MTVKKGEFLIMENESWYIINSKYNCEHYYRLNPYELPDIVTTLTTEQLKEKKEKYSELIELTRFFVKKLFFFLNDIPAIILISDEECNILKLIGSEDIKQKTGIKEGTCLHEKYAGTNSIYLCLNHNQPIQVWGDDHFHYALHHFSCSSCKFHLENGLAGTITLMTTAEESSSFHLGLVSSAVDSIEREIELRKKNKQLNLFNQIIINSTKNGIIITDQNGVITEFNEVAENYTGFKRENIIGGKFDIFKDFSHYIKTVLTTKNKFENIEIHFAHNKKTKKVCLFDALPIYDGEHLIGSFSQFRDITERYELEQQIIANEKLSVIGKMSAGLAHEIRNPLTPIGGFLQLLESNFNNEKAKLYFSIIKEELKRINDLVTNFVIVSRPEAPSREEINIQELIFSTLHLMESQANLHNISLKLKDLINDELFIYIDKNQIKQVLINLIQNAIEEMKAGGDIMIILDKNVSENFVEISVKDQGSGIDPEILKNLFTPFLTTKDAGTGLGLSVCHRIIQNHHGTIEVDTTKNKGTTFTVKLPILSNIKKDKSKK